MTLLILAPAKTCITHESLQFLPTTLFGCVLQEIRNMHNEQLMGIRGEEEMEMSDDDMEDSSATNSKDSEDSGKFFWFDSKKCTGAE